MFPPVLRREILILLGVKAAMLAALYLIWFSPPHRVSPTPQTMQSHILGDRD